MALATFIENGFLQTMFSKSGDGTLDKATLLTTTFSDGADPKYFAEQSKTTNIQPMTLFLDSLLRTVSSNKSPQHPVDKAQLLVDMFGESANLNNFAQQAAATNIQPTTSHYYFL
ncbi:hypothetical protein RhiirA4_489051 [Rhizophagus irregularis]|uniref:Uncharacterized protein n=1 Tax=Rhizophagus irregularis TaxID=588596 RepID=A0A2I1HUE5_9GLOM|nr:hypothetical protein RhiirA4_489051 [Rhizophagus irregularis]